MQESAADHLRREHIELFIRGRGVCDKRVLRALQDVPRDLFAPGMSLNDVYGDHPLPIGCGQTVSQPYMVAWMTELLRVSEEDRVLEIGTGSGYQTAVLARLAKEVCTVERLPALTVRAQAVLGELNLVNVRYRVGDGTVGWAEQAPYNAICVTAGAPRVPPPLQAQLADGGRLVIPVGDRMLQSLVLVERCGSRYNMRELGGCRFVPLVGAEGWPSGQT